MTSRSRKWTVLACLAGLFGLVVVISGACSSEKKSKKADEEPTQEKAEQAKKETAEKEDWRWKGDWKKYNKSEWIERGEVLVNNVLLCKDCHTKRKKDFSFDMDRHLAGHEQFFNFVPDNDKVGFTPVANITPSKSGIRSWSPDKLKSAITEGQYETEAGEPYILHPIMPYYAFNNLKDEHIKPVLAYLRSLKPVDVNIPDRQPQAPPWKPIDERTEPVQPLKLEDVPETTLSERDDGFEAAQEGKYWATLACSECHSPTIPPNPKKGPNQDYSPTIPAQVFRGSMPFPAGQLGLPVPPFPELIWSPNLTPHEHGLEDYSAEDIVNTMNSGKDVEGHKVCPPMPAGPEEALSDMPDDIQQKIATYIDSLEPKPSAKHPLFEKMGIEPPPPECEHPSPEELKEAMKKKKMKKDGKNEEKEK